jgi:hypothetical protein
MEKSTTRNLLMESPGTSAFTNVEGVREMRLCKKKKRIRFVLDCSGSMYRSNGYDQRLMRCLEAALLIMESYDGFGDSV